MAVNVTYLLGAGASYEILPLVKEVKNGNGEVIKKSLGNDILEIAAKYKGLKQRSSTNPDVFNEIIHDLSFLGNKCNFFSSPDTYIRSLYLRDPTDSHIERCKLTFSFYLSLRQYLHNDFLDRRYIPFFASILSNNAGRVQIPKNINLITWNYDFQIEAALMFFETSQDTLDKAQEHFKSIPANVEILNPKIIHLNGIGGFYLSGGQRGFYPERRVHYENEVIHLTEAVRTYNEIVRSSTVQDNLTFAWELSAKNHRRIEVAKDIASQSDILVVIGYSFPFFNRAIDKELFDGFTSKSGKRKKIYIQDPNINEDSISFIRQRFDIKSQLVDIIPIPSVEQFFLPPEL